jgi:amino acid transporter
LLTLGLATTFFCTLRLQDVISALVVIRIMVQFLMQVIGLLLLRARRPDFPRPFRMYLYPIPAVLAALGFIYILYARPTLKEIRFGAVIAFIGLIIFIARSWQRKEWPFSGLPAHNPVHESVQ